MAARITKLRTQADRLHQTDGSALRQLVLDYAAGSDGVSGRAVGEIVAAIDRETASRNGWTFVMISPEANNAIVEWLFANSTRPQVAVRLWLKMFMHLRTDTGEVIQTRDEMAASVGIRRNHVSEIMSELEGIGAISRRKDGRGVRYFMSPRAGTCLSGAARDAAQAASPPLTFAKKSKSETKAKLAAVPAVG